MSKWAFYWHFFDYREVKTTEDKFIQVGQCSRGDVYKLNVAGLYPGQNNCIAKTTVTFHVKYNKMLVLVFLAYLSDLQFIGTLLSSLYSNTADTILEAECL